MARASIKLDTSDFRAVLNNFAEFSSKAVPTLVRAHARLCAVHLAARTTPFSTGGKTAKEKGDASTAAKKLGEACVERDIKRVIHGKDDFIAFCSNFGNERIRNRITELAQNGDWQALTHVMNNIGIFKSQGGIDFLNEYQYNTIHQRYRNKTTGRTGKVAKKYHVATTPLKGYINKVMKRVGMSKGGWAECARKIGELSAGKDGKAADNARGIPAWAKRSKKGGEVSDQTRGAGYPHVLLTNTFPWISRICTRESQDEAVRMASESMVLSFEHAILAAAKKETDIRKLAQKLSAMAS